MDTPFKRVLRYLWFAIGNFALIYWLMLPLNPITVWWFGGMIVASGVADVLVLAWSLNHVPSQGLTSEVAVNSIWAVVQLVVILMVAWFLATNFGAIAILVLAFQLGWMRWRIDTLNKVMDVRYWDSNEGDRHD